MSMPIEGGAKASVPKVAAKSPSGDAKPKPEPKPKPADTSGPTGDAKAGAAATKDKPATKPTSTTTTPATTTPATTTTTSTTAPTKPGASTPASTKPASSTTPATTNSTPADEPDRPVPATGSPKPGGGSAGSDPATSTPDTRPATDKQPPVAGGTDANARTNATPAGTSATEVDAKAPAADRPALQQGQSQAETRAQEARREATKHGDNGTEAYRQTMATYYESHPVYVDTDGTAYAASYDAKSGDLTLTRNNDGSAPPAERPPAGSKSDPAPWSNSSRTRQQAEAAQADADNAGKDGTSGGGMIGPVAPDKENTTKRTAGPKQASVATGTGVAAGSGVAGAAGAGAPNEAPAPAPGTDADPKTPSKQQSIPGMPSGVTTDTQIVIAADGTRTTSRATSPTDPVGRDFTTRSVVVTKPDGTEVDATRTHDETTIAEDGTTTTITDREQRHDDKVTSSGTSTAVDGPGGSWKTSVDHTYVDGKQTKEVRSTHAAHDGVTLDETATTDFTNGLPDRTVVDRSLDTGRTRDKKFLWFDVGDEPIRGTSHYELDYDGQANVTAITGDKPVNGHDPLDALLTETLGAPKPGERRLTFGPIEMPGTEQEVEGRKYTSPGYLSEPGISAVIEGKNVFMEGGRPNGDGHTNSVLGQFEQSLKSAPEVLRSGEDNFQFLQGRSPGDAYWSARYGSDFTSAATSGGSGITFWLGSPPDEHTMYHELGHSSYDPAKGAPAQDAWKAAMLADQKNGAPVALAKEGQTLILTNGASLEDQPGISEYADKAYASNENINEDWADSTALYIESRNNGGLIQVKQADGTVVTKQFEDVYPARAKLLDSYYHITTETPLAETPEWVDPPAKGGGIGGLGGFGGLFGGAGSILGGIVDGSAGAAGGTKKGAKTPADVAEDTAKDMQEFQHVVGTMTAPPPENGN